MSIDLNWFINLVPVVSLDPAGRRHLAGMAESQTYSAGDSVFERGADDSDFIYLHDGEVELVDAAGRSTLVKAGCDESRYPLSNLKPRRFGCRVTSPSATLIRIDGRAVEHALAREQMGESLNARAGERGESVEEMDAAAAQEMDWTLALLQTKAFLRLPSSNIEQLFEKLEPCAVEAGQVVVRYGEPGDYFYFIQRGRCAVSRPTPGGGEIRLAELGQLESFGGDALISDEPRNATVTMLTDGLLLRLSKEDFSELLKNPLVKWVDLREASRLVREGAARVDVRTEQEHAHNGIKGSINIPLYLVRLKFQSLSPKRKYVLFCDTGVRSEAAAFILADRGFDVYVLRGGLSSVMEMLPHS